MIPFKKEKPTPAATDVSELKQMLPYFTSHFKRNFRSRQVLWYVCGFHPSNEYYDRLRIWRAMSLKSHCNDSSS